MTSTQSAWYENTGNFYSKDYEMNEIVAPVSIKQRAARIWCYYLSAGVIARSNTRLEAGNDNVQTYTSGFTGLETSIPEFYVWIFG